MTHQVTIFWFILSTSKPLHRSRPISCSTERALVFIQQFWCLYRWAVNKTIIMLLFKFSRQNIFGGPWLFSHFHYQYLFALMLFLNSSLLKQQQKRYIASYSRAAVAFSFLCSGVPLFYVSVCHYFTVEQETFLDTETWVDGLKLNWVVSWQAQFVLRIESILWRLFLFIAFGFPLPLHDLSRKTTSG